MKRLCWRKLIVVFLMLWLPGSQMRALNLPVCGLQADVMDRAMHGGLKAKAQGGEEAGATEPCGHQGTFDCMVFTHCDLCNAWAVTPPVSLFQTSPFSFLILFHLPSSGQFDPDRLERPPRNIVS